MKRILVSEKSNIIGERAVTDIELDAISKVLGVSLDYLFGRE